MKCGLTITRAAEVLSVTAGSSAQTTFLIRCLSLKCGDDVLCGVITSTDAGVVSVRIKVAFLATGAQ